MTASVAFGICLQTQVSSGFRLRKPIQKDRAPSRPDRLLLWCGQRKGRESEKTPIGFLKCFNHFQHLRLPARVDGGVWHPAC